MTDVVMKDAGMAGVREEEPRDGKAHDPLRRPLEDGGWKIKNSRSRRSSVFK